MHRNRLTFPKVHQLAARATIVIGLLTVGALPFFPREHVKNETIEATAMGTGTQLGATFGVSLEIYDYSTPEDRQVLIQAFEKGQKQGTGTLGCDVAYIRMIPTPTGRKIRFVTNRLLRFGEVHWDTQSTAFNLTAGEFDLNDQDKSKSAGVNYLSSSTNYRL